MDVRDKLIQQDADEFIKDLKNLREIQILEIKGILTTIYEQLNKTRMALMMLRKENDDMSDEDIKESEKTTIDIYTMMLRVEDKVNIINEYLK